ncbi:MAG: hypothetical protein KF734_16460 [Saprospiraceae bacterium]|nr:hypothetical protein [Saprospiraceae bacterium]
MKILLLTLSALTMLAAEKCRKNVASTPLPLLSLETGPCFGFCPVFKLDALDNGLVRYEGIQFVEKEGRDSFRLTKEELKQLKTKTQEVNLWQYPDQIQTDVVDAPFATLTAYNRDKSKSVRGSIDRPTPLLQLEDLLKDLAEAHGIQVKRGVNPNSPASGSQREVVVHLKPEVNAGNWLAQFGELRLRLVRRLAAENIWLVAYNPNEIGEKELISLLKDMDGVVDVQTNLPVKERD